MAPDGQTPEKKAEQPEGDAKPAAKKPQQLHVVNANEAAKRTYKAQRRRRIITIASFVMLVVIPTILASVYWFAFAADRYAVETKFAVRSPTNSVPSGDLLSMMTTMSSAGSTMSDSYMLVEFVESRDLIERLQDKVDLREIYNTEQADFLTRLKDDASPEELRSYLDRWVSIYFDTSSQILTLEVQAFSPENARALSAAILEISSDLVNEVSEQARFDSMESAEREVARVEQQLEEHRRAMVSFRDERQDINPEASAGAQVQLLGQLETQLATARTRLNSLLNYLSEDAPTVRVLKNEIQSLERQLSDQRERLGTGDNGGRVVSEDGSGEENLTMSERLGVYEGLAVDLEFLQQAYVSALASREAARLEADRQQRYIASFVRPTLPQDPTYPKPVRNILVFIAFATMLWGIVLMVFYVVREHAT